MTIDTFEDVVAWQKGKDLYVGLYKELVNSKNYSFKDQILRAALSITNNIAEGFDRRSNKELKQFLTIARGSAAEVRSMLKVSQELNLIPVEKQENYIKLSKDTSRLLTGFIRSLNQQNTENRQLTTKAVK